MRRCTWTPLHGEDACRPGTSTHEDIKSKDRCLNLMNTLNSLLVDIVPIINENDALSFTEIKFGDNADPAFL